MLLVLNFSEHFSFHYFVQSLRSGGNQSASQRANQPAAAAQLQIVWYAQCSKKHPRCFALLVTRPLWEQTERWDLIVEASNTWRREDVEKYLPWRTEEDQRNTNNRRGTWAEKTWTKGWLLYLIMFVMETWSSSSCFRIFWRWKMKLEKRQKRKWWWRWRRERGGKNRWGGAAGWNIIPTEAAVKQ